MTERRPIASEGVRVGKWWALLRGPNRLPVLFDSKQSALDNRDPDEYIVQVYVTPARARDREKRKGQSR